MEDEPGVRRIVRADPCADREMKAADSRAASESIGGRG
jgi:hypothetical protein